jgi:hypothetical protein
MKLLSLASLSAALLVAACSNRRDAASDSARGDTIAVPAAAVDTTQRTMTDSTGASVTVGAPGAGTAQSGAQAATGVDTPITRKIREGEKKNP